MSRKTIVSILFITVIIGYFVFTKGKDSAGEGEAFILDQAVFESTPLPISSSVESREKDGLRTFVFDSFHGSTNISDKFQFQYPADWYNDGQYFSPVKIQYYNQFTARAPIYFDLVLDEIFNLTELQYKIDNSKRRSPDTTGIIDGKEFRRYDLIDYGSYGGESAGRIKIFVGPKIKIDGADYYLIFHWEERPLAESMLGNSIEIFDSMLLTLKFFD